MYQEPRQEQERCSTPSIHLRDPNPDIQNHELDDNYQQFLNFLKKPIEKKKVRGVPNVPTNLKCEVHFLINGHIDMPSRELAKLEGRSNTQMEDEEEGELELEACNYQFHYEESQWVIPDNKVALIPSAAEISTELPAAYINWAHPVHSLQQCCYATQQHFAYNYMPMMDVNSQYYVNYNAY